MRYLFVILPLTLTSCFSKVKRTENYDAFKDEVEQRKIKQVRPAEILEEARRRGKTIADSATKVLFSELSHALKTHGTDSAIGYCNISAFPTLEGLSQKLKAQIKRTSTKVRNPLNKPDSLENILLRAYIYAQENGSEPSESIQFVNNEKELLFTRPIMIKQGLCLTCHGAQLSSKVAQKLVQLYPNDNATDYKLGDFRGMWSIRFIRKDIVIDL